MASPNLSNMMARSVKYYLVEGDWFRKVFPILMTRDPDLIQEDWRTSLGTLENLKLIDQRCVLQEDDDETQFHLAPDLHGETRLLGLRDDVHHQKEFFCVGASAWALIREKFDWDGITIERPCELLTPSDFRPNLLTVNAWQSTYHGIKADIPLTGRFPYERVIPPLGQNEINGGGESKGHATTQNNGSAAIVPDDDGDANEVRRNHKRVEQGRPFHVYHCCLHAVERI